MVAHLIAEHKTIVLPERPGLESVAKLLGPMLPEQLHNGRGGGNRPALAVLGGNKTVLPGLAGDVLELLVD